MIEYQSTKRKRIYFSRSLHERFLERCNKTSSCWLWTGPPGSHGYGVFFISKRPKIVTELAHRVSWKLNGGSIQEGQQVLHKCDVRLCVNPAHLFLGSQKDNVHDMMKKGRGPGKLSVSQAEEIKASEGSSRKIAERFDVSKSTVLNIRRGKTWRNYLERSQP